MVNNSSAVDFIPRERFRDRVEEDICSGLSDWDEQRSKGFIGRELSLLLVVAILRRHVHFSFYAKDLTSGSLMVWIKKVCILLCSYRPALASSYATNEDTI